MTTGLFGGTFDPIHFGHLYQIKWAFEQHRTLDRVIVVPSHDHPYGKQPRLPFEVRLETTKLALETYQKWFGGYVYTVDVRKLRLPRETSFELLSHFEPWEDLTLMVGDDISDGEIVSRWHRGASLVSRWPVLRCPRDAVTGELLPTGERLATPPSSTLVRADLLAGERPLACPPPVYERILGWFGGEAFREAPTTPVRPAADLFRTLSDSEFENVSVPSSDEIRGALKRGSEILAKLRRH